MSQHHLTDLLTEAATAAADELARKDALSIAVLHTAESLLKNADWQTDVAHVLERLGRASRVSRVYVFENHTDNEGRLLTSQRFEWSDHDVEPQIDNPDLQSLSLVDAGFERWEKVLGAGAIVQGPVGDFPDAEREFLEAQDIRSLAVVPIFVGDEWWGFMGFDDCTEARRWTESSLAVLGTAADLFGAAIFRLDAEDDRRRLHEEQTARREAHEARERAAFLAEATAILTSSFDYDTTLARFAQMTVPFLGDYCIVDIIDGGLIRRVATAHADPAMGSVVRGLERFPPKWDSNPIVRALRSGRSVKAGPDELTPDAISGEPEHRALLEQLDPRHGIFAPIRASSGVIGVMSLCSCDPERDYGTEELGFAEDIAARAGIAISNAQLFQAAEQAKRTRDEVLAVVAHDLRNPLGSITGGAQMLQDLVNDEGALRVAGIIRRSADRMNRLIEDLLDATRLERGKLSVDPSPLRLRAIIGEAATMLRPLADGRGIDFEVACPDDGAFILADSARILQVLSNLVGNALKFTPEGGRVELRARADQGTALVQVEDTGPGIPQDKVPHLFNQFWQANEADRRGVGLGLSIARGIVEAHDGRIWVESEEGSGSVFSFVIPLAAPAETPLAPIAQ